MICMKKKGLRICNGDLFGRKELFLGGLYVLFKTVFNYLLPEINHHCLESRNHIG